MIRFKIMQKLHHGATKTKQKTPKQPTIYIEGCLPESCISFFTHFTGEAFKSLDNNLKRSQVYKFSS